ncbi:MULTISPECIES: glycerophosphoryl diester phosphodiesterase membrane domain-containing protein [unclassified Microcoleus]|uniref:glycerophosphoryl diester phosphodiesterase membrane domain-containing protein n=1 Tax=unclassified Microcoleus TaxID=2642155 RepID=UPI002FD720FF
MTTQPISAINLLRETFAAIRDLYTPLLIINSPSLIFAVLEIFNLGSAGVGLTFINLYVVIPFLSGAMIFYICRSFTENPVTVNEAFQQANRRLLPILSSYILSMLFILLGFIALIIPGFYVSFRLTFSLFAAVLDNSSAQDSIRKSWELTKGHWWLVCRSTFLIVLVFLMPLILIVLLVDLTGQSLASQIVSNILVFLILPFMTVYIVLLYQSLQQSATTIE